MDNLQLDQIVFLAAAAVMVVMYILVMIDNLIGTKLIAKNYDVEAQHMQPLGKRECRNGKVYDAVRNSVTGEEYFVMGIQYRDINTLQIVRNVIAERYTWNAGHILKGTTKRQF